MADNYLKLWADYYYYYYYYHGIEVGFYLSEPTPLRIYVSQSSLTENLYKFILATTTTVYLEKQQRQRKFSSAQQGGDFTQTLITGVQ